MYYFTCKQAPACHQMTLEEYLFGGDSWKNESVSKNTTSTRTYAVEKISEKMQRFANADRLIAKLENFNNSTKKFRENPIKDFYYEFHIPKKSGGLRKIDAPNEELKAAQYALKAILEDDFNALYHTSAFAYIKNRSTIDAVNMHINNNSQWYGKLDLSNFFGSTTPEFVMKQLSSIYPFCEVCKVPRGKKALEEAMEVAFLDGGLPQGTPLSPLLTNIIMIPVDHIISNRLRDFDGNHYVYTRYADDFIISSRCKFDIYKIVNFIDEVLNSFDAPFNINAKKTRYGSAAGRNWCLGVMITKNEDGDVYKSIGRQKKRQFETMLYSFVNDTRNGIPWSLEDVMTLEGYRNYYEMVEGKSISAIVDFIGKKMNADIVSMIKEQLRA